MKNSSKTKTSPVKNRRVVLSIAQILAGASQNPTPAGKRKKETPKRKKPLKPILPPKSMVVVLKDKPEKSVYHRRILDYKHCGLLQRYIGMGGKILPRRQTRLTAKQQRYVARTIKTARVMGLLPFVNKERVFFRSCDCDFNEIEEEVAEENDLIQFMVHMVHVSSFVLLALVSDELLSFLSRTNAAQLREFR